MELTSAREAQRCCLFSGDGAAVGRRGTRQQVQNQLLVLLHGIYRQ